jgi:hypothetical protein
MANDKKQPGLYANGVPVGSGVPTNRQAAKRPYCAKHSRAMLDIGGEKKYPVCIRKRPAPRRG